MNSEQIQDWVQEQMSEYPIMETALLPAEDISFSGRVRQVCELECPRYHTSWSCPPAVGTVEECAKRCAEFTHCFVFSSIAEVNDITNLEETLATRMAHEELTRKVRDLFRERFGEVLALSTESCDLCEHCAYPDGPCRQPERMFPCVESYGILVTELAEKSGMSFDNGANVITWFSVLFFHLV